MKNKKLLTLLIAGGMLLAACGGGGKKTPTPTPTPTPSVTPVAHQDPFVRNVEEGTLLRSYNEQFDVMVDDFSSENLKGELDGERNQGVLRVLVDSETGEGEFPNSPDAAIYKTASAAFDAARPDIVGFKMRKVGAGTLSIGDLILGSRGDDAFNVYEINLGEAYDSDNELLPELTNEWQDIEVDFGNTIEDDTTEYELKDGGASGVRVLDKMVGFHLYADADADISQVIEIAEVYTIKGVTKTVVDVFDHPTVDKNPSFAPYWVNSTGFVVRKGVNIEDGSYEVALPAEAAGYENLVLELNGDGSTLKVNGKDAPLNVVNGAFHDFVLNLAEAEIELGETVKLESTKELNVSAIFVSNLQEKEAATEYPVIDIENRVVFDDFEREQASFTDNWDTASTADYKPDTISVALSYSNGNLASVHDGSLFVQQPEGYVNVKEANGVAAHPLQYLVVVAKGSIEGFRLASEPANAMWSHDWLAGPGLKSIPTDLDSYPYQYNGYVHYIIDLEEMGSDIGSSDFIDMYFNNAVEIDSIYFARKAANYGEVKDTLTGTNPDLSGWAYLGWAYLGGAYQLDLHIEGEGNLRSLRFVDDDGEYWFKDNKIIGLDGQPISDTLSFDAEHPLDISIDVAKTGFVSEGVHLHSGGFDGSTGSITLVGYTRHYTDPWREVDNISLGTGTSEGYAYLGAYGQQERQASVIEVSMVASAEGADIGTFRIEGAELRFANANQLIGEDGKIIDQNTPISADAEHPTVIRIDLAATFGAVNPFKDDGFLHFHFGGWGTSEATVTFSAKGYVPFTAEYELDWYYAK